MEFYRRCLIQIFGILEEYEVGREGDPPLLDPAAEGTPAGGAESLELPEAPARGLAEQTLLPEASSPSAEEVAETAVEPRPRQASKYDKLPIRVEETGEEWEEMEARWAELSRPNGFVSGLLHWRGGGGDSTHHILTHFEPCTADPAPPDLRSEGEEQGGREVEAETLETAGKTRSKVRGQ